MLLLKGHSFLHTSLMVIMVKIIMVINKRCLLISDPKNDVADLSGHFVAYFRKKMISFGKIGGGVGGRS